LLANGPERAKIADIMSFPVISISPEATMRQAQTMMAREKVRGLMVLDGEELCGIIVLWDFKKLKRESHWQSPVKAFMVRKLHTIEPSASPAAAARLMIKNDIGYLPVLQEGKLIGIVTRTDILTYYYDMLPE
ncbi:MAG TPA: CBS domain-containing protein, partial [Desulforhopalus sp.]|nr:CBS domain-containing protein [Desulforhopalus sp.]